MTVFVFISTNLSMKLVFRFHIHQSFYFESFSNTQAFSLTANSKQLTDFLQNNPVFLKTVN